MYFAELKIHLPGAFFAKIQRWPLPAAARRMEATTITSIPFDRLWENPVPNLRPGKIEHWTRRWWVTSQ